MLGASTHEYIYTQAFFTHRYSTDTSTKRCFARMLLHRDAFTHRRFQTRTLLGRGTSAWVSLGTRFTGLGHFGFKLPSNITSTFTYKSGFCRKMLLHTSALTQGEAFPQRWFKKRNDFTKRCFYKQVLLRRDAFNTEMPVHQVL